MPPPGKAGSDELVAVAPADEPVAPALTALVDEAPVEDAAPPVDVAIGGLTTVVLAVWLALPATAVDVGAPLRTNLPPSGTAGSDELVTVPPAAEPGPPPLTT